MRTDNLKVKLTIPIPVGKPDCNGIVYSKKAVENAINNLHKNLPIIYRDDEIEEEVVIGNTTGNSHIVTWNSENQVCNVTVDGVVYFGGAECIIKEMDNGVVTDFDIVAIGLSK